MANSVFLGNGTGSGNVVGPLSATNGNLAVFDGTSGTLIKDGGVPGNPFDQNLNTTDTAQFTGVGIGATPVVGKVNWTDMQLYERAPVGVYANPQLVLADPDAGASVFVFHPYGTETLSFETGAMFTSNATFTLRVPSGGDILFTDEDTNNYAGFNAGTNIFGLSAGGTLAWNATDVTLVDNAGSLEISTSGDSVVFMGIGVEFSDFAIHPVTGGEGSGSIGTEDIPFASGYFATSVVTPLVSSTGSLDLTGVDAANVTATGGNITLDASGGGGNTVFLYGGGGASVTVAANGGITVEASSQALNLSTVTSGDIKINTAGNLNILGLPTSAAGLASGDVWANSNVLTIVP